MWLILGVFDDAHKSDLATLAHRGRHQLVGL